MIVYHSNRSDGDNTVVKAYGFKQWFGDGYYFWQDKDFAEFWGRTHVCKNGICSYNLYVVDLDVDFDSDNVLDTVFNENDYNFFVEVYDKFASNFFERKKKKPTIEEFNFFIGNKKIFGDNIIAIRFADNPNNSKVDYVKIMDLHYRKRIQIAVFENGVHKVLNYTTILKK